MIERLIASGRDLGDVENKKGKGLTALEVAREWNQTEVEQLLENFREPNTDSP